MPVCKSCETPFGTYTKIAGVLKNLCNRHYCLECVPFGSRKGKPGQTGRPCVCRVCGKKFLYERKKGLSTTRCAGCAVSERKIKMKKALIELRGGKCKNCGYNRCLNALSFHHRNPRTKKFNVAGNYNRSWKANLAEAKKCDILCMNCHTELHAKEDEQRRIAQRKKHRRDMTKVGSSILPTPTIRHTHVSPRSEGVG
jgi:hypothetical protein